MFWKPLFHTLARLSIRLTLDLCNIRRKIIKRILIIRSCLSEYIFSGCGPWWLFALYVGNTVSKPHKTWNTWTLGQYEEAHQISSIFKARGCYSLRKFDQGNWKLQPEFMFFLFQSVWTPLIGTYTMFLVFHEWFISLKIMILYCKRTPEAQWVFKHWVHHRNPTTLLKSCIKP